jgi:hypothetical protein
MRYVRTVGRCNLTRSRNMLFQREPNEIEPIERTQWRLAVRTPSNQKNLEHAVDRHKPRPTEIESDRDDASVCEFVKIAILPTLSLKTWETASAGSGAFDLCAKPANCRRWYENERRRSPTSALAWNPTSSADVCKFLKVNCDISLLIDGYFFR